MEYINIEEIYVGLSAGAQGADRIELAPFALEPWGEDIDSTMRG